MTKPFSSLCAALLAATLALPAVAETTTMIVMDGSGSMWGQIDGRTKLEVARETVADVLMDVPGDRVLGLMAYGHRERGNCSDIELMVTPAAGSAGAILDAVNTMRFQGKTPLTEAVRQAAEVLRSTEAPATVVLVTDGIETCEADPCALAAELEASGVDFTAHVIGFGLSRAEGTEVACIAENTGGRYF
jgi:Ca-activated chloride channel family protein